MTTDFFITYYTTVDLVRLFYIVASYPRLQVVLIALRIVKSVYGYTVLILDFEVGLHDINGVKKIYNTRRYNNSLVLVFF